MYNLKQSIYCLKASSDFQYHILNLKIKGE